MNKEQSFRLEHYKSLREEYREHVQYIQSLWNFKLSALGAVAAISIFNHQLLELDQLKNQTSLDATLIISIGLLALPLFAFLIDLKIVEIGMQVKLISNHLKTKFSDISEIATWENSLWNAAMGFSRTILSLVLYVGASIVILVISLLTVNVLQPSWGTHLLVGGIILLVIPIIGTLVLLPKILK